MNLFEIFFIAVASIFILLIGAISILAALVIVVMTDVRFWIVAGVAWLVSQQI